MKTKDLLAVLKEVAPKKPISFVSTRDSQAKVSFWRSLVQGVAADGGLLVPEYIPQLPAELLSSKSFWKNLEVSDISAIILRSFAAAEEVSDAELSEMMKIAHNFKIPLEQLGGMWIARLDQGPTASFKDIAARALGQLIDLYCRKHSKKISIIVATSGDTGVAVADAFGGSAYVNVTVMYPSQGVSEVQEKQMLAVHHAYENEQVIPVKGNFDMCQDIAKLIQESRGTAGIAGSAKKLAQDAEFKLGLQMSEAEITAMANTVDELNVSSANSINIWRLIPQMTQYFASYAELVSKGRIAPGEQIVFSVPTGNVGHVMAGIYAREMGLPIKLFVVGTNANNILANVVGSGVLKNRGFVKTSSPSMDILDPSNLERLLVYSAGKIDGSNKAAPVQKIDFIKMKQDIKRLSNDDSLGIDLKNYGVTEAMLEQLQSLLWVEDVETDDEVYAMMRHVAETSGTVLEPHGVTGYVAALRAKAKKVVAEDDIVVIFETAHPDKFPEALRASGVKRSKITKHPILEKIMRKDFKMLKKPQAVEPNPALIVKKMQML